MEAPSPVLPSLPESDPYMPCLQEVDLEENKEDPEAMLETAEDFSLRLLYT